MSPTKVLTNLLYPPACLLCHAPLPAPPGGAPACSATGVAADRQAGLPVSRVPQEEASAIVCETCRQAMPRSGRPLCPRCGVTLSGAFDATLLCALCRSASPTFDMARAPWQYAGTVQTAIRQFKYHQRWRLGRWLAQEMAALAHSSFPLPEIAIVLPVPLHWLKLRVKGCNPAQQLAVSVAQRLQKPCVAHALRRIRWTRSQTGLQGAARARNVQQAFAAHPSMVRERSVLLVDDVHTSGATLNACARALKTAGARRVFALTAARTPLA